MLYGARGGAIAGSKIGGAIGLLVIVLAFLSDTTFLAKWKMSPVMLSVVYLIGGMLSGGVAGALGIFATTRLRAFFVGLLSALPFALMVAWGRYGTEGTLADYVVPASIWAALMGGGLGVMYYHSTRDR
jgi:hypothetical protein